MEVFKQENIDVFYTITGEMDTVCNKQAIPIQTFLFENTIFMFKRLRKDKASLSMTKSLEYL